MGWRYLSQEVYHDTSIDGKTSGHCFIGTIELYMNSELLQTTIAFVRNKGASMVAINASSSCSLLPKMWENVCIHMLVLASQQTVSLPRKESQSAPLHKRFFVRTKPLPARRSPKAHRFTRSDIICHMWYTVNHENSDKYSVQRNGQTLPQEAFRASWYHPNGCGKASHTPPCSKRGNTCGG